MRESQVKIYEPKNSQGSHRGRTFNICVGFTLLFMTALAQTSPPLPPLPSLETSYPIGAQDREVTLAILLKIATPVIGSLSENKLRQSIPTNPWEGNRKQFSVVEAFARTLCGIAPWLELGPDNTPEGHNREAMIKMACASIGNIVDPSSPDYVNWGEENQMLVEGAFFALALLRAPKQLWKGLAAEDRVRVLEELKKTRSVKPCQNNWLLFSAMIEVALWKFSGEFERQPIETAVKKHMEWYLGDGTFGDGPEYHWDYYNSYVIHPMLLDILGVCKEKRDLLGDLFPVALARARRYAVVQERMISPEGTYPLIGRSSIYRVGAFQLLSQIFLIHQSPPQILPGAVRAALTTVIRRMHEAPGTFDSGGWLQFGLVGLQPGVRDSYNSKGSTYLTTFGFLHLGLSAEDPFWTMAGSAWTQRKIWVGDPTCGSDGAYHEH
jgi:hypothetical protein